mgnify:CR=1 FL=1
MRTVGCAAGFPRKVSAMIMKRSGKCDHQAEGETDGSFLAVRPAIPVARRSGRKPRRPVKRQSAYAIPPGRAQLFLTSDFRKVAEQFPATMRLSLRPLRYSPAKFLRGDWEYALGHLDPAESSLDREVLFVTFLQSGR